MSTQTALQELESYAAMAVRHSYDQYEKHGTLHAKARSAFHDESIWKHKWVPDSFDIGEARLHPIFQHKLSSEQQLAWNHLQWALDYSSVAQGERQIVVLNSYAVESYRDVLPSIVELERRESFEECDHIEAFSMVLEGVRQRYFQRSKEPLWSKTASGFASSLANKAVRHTIGRVGNALFGANFPTLYFLARGMKTHGFKPFENAITTFDDGHATMKMISHLHRLDESRHMATSLHLARLSTAVLDNIPQENKLLFTAAVQACFPKGRSAFYRLDWWRRVLDTSTLYDTLSQEEKDELYRHIEARTHANLASLHEVQGRLTRQANKRIVEECGLSPSLKKIFVDVMRGDPAYAATVEAVQLGEA